MREPAIDRSTEHTHTAYVRTASEVGEEANVYTASACDLFVCRRSLLWCFLFCLHGGMYDVYTGVSVGFPCLRVGLIV